MGEAWDEAGAFGELRSRVNGPASGRSFGRILGLVEEAERCEPGLYEARWRAYVEGSLGGWPPETCATKVWGREAAIEAAAAPWRGLLKGLTLRGFDLGRREDAEWIAGDLRASFTDLEHLGFLGMYVIKAQIARACSVGTFDEVASLSFQDCAFRPETFDLLMSHLESAGDVKRLAFRQCRLGVDQIERLCASPLRRSLEALDLSWNQGIKTAGCEVLARTVGEFESMRELSLGGTGMSVAGASALARADWSPAMEHLELRGAAISTGGLEAFVDAGRVGLLARRGARTRLDLWGFSLRDRALTALAGCADLAEVDDLWLHGNALGAVAPLLGSPHLGALESLDMSGNALDHRSTDALIALVDRTRPRALGVDDMALGEGFVEQLCASAGAERLEALAMTHHDCYAERALEALLDWPRLPELRALHASCSVPEASPLVARAVETGWFGAPAQAPREGRVMLRSDRGYVFEP